MSWQEDPNSFMSFSAAAVDKISALFLCSLHPANKRGSAVVVRAHSKEHSKKLKLDPPRITSNVKLSLQFLRRIKENKSGAKPATSYRRKKVEKVDTLADEEEDWTDYDKFQKSLTEFEMARPVLLVDGYNMCGYWPKLKKLFKKGRLDAARQILLDELVGFSAIRSTKVVVVFDAAASGLPDHKETYQEIDVVFTATASADSWIEKEVTLLKQDGCPKVWVATSDHLQQQCAHGLGAYVWSCRYLIAAIKDAKKERDQILLDLKSYSMKGKLLEDNLDPEVRLSLKMLKKKLLESEPS